LKSGWIADVSSRWEDRIFGQSWDDFLKNSRVILGSESGSNCFNLDGRLTVDSGNKGQEKPELISKYEGNIIYGTIAPRHLEAAAHARPQILLPGKYENIFRDGESVLFAKAELENLEQLLTILEDDRLASSIGVQARDAVLSRQDLRIRFFWKSWQKI